MSGADSAQWGARTPARDPARGRDRESRLDPARDWLAVAVRVGCSYDVNATQQPPVKQIYVATSGAGNSPAVSIAFARRP